MGPLKTLRVQVVIQSVSEDVPQQGGWGVFGALICRLQQCVFVCECFTRGVASSLLNVLTVTLDSLCH